MVRGVRAIAERPVDHPHAILPDNICRLLEIPFCRHVRVRVETRVSHEVVNLNGSEGVFECFLHVQYYFKAELRQHRLNMKYVEAPPPFLVQVAAENGHEVGEKPVDDGVRDVTQSDSVLFGTSQRESQLQSVTQRKDTAERISKNQSLVRMICEERTISYSFHWM